jgi:hypothetical protein
MQESDANNIGGDQEKAPLNNSIAKLNCNYI